jgi:hypothetical protein
MAIKLQSKTQHWNVLSSDAFPGTAITEGSTIHVIDTGEEYIYHDGTWEQDMRRIYASREG